ncbi:MAG: thymidine phosphorylase [Spirochaetes bacterium]|nr:thymidine phosphorylase [Spirochaetota bacterium]
MNDIIARKKAGQKLTNEEIQKFVSGVTSGEIPDYQTSALLMAICFRGMDVEERSQLTLAMAASGKKLNFRTVKGRKADKHSTGGVGDKTSLILAPWLAAAGVKIPMISGRGLGFTGGTLDKLAAIPGYRSDYRAGKLRTLLKRNGCFIVGQTKDIAPADKKIYALRDVTATVDEMSLITASILSKKFAEDIDTLVMDVKCGSGAFMQNLGDARALAESIFDTANKAGLFTLCLVTQMDFPLGIYTGNAIETWEAREFCDPKNIYRAAAEKIYIKRAQLTAAEHLVAPLVEITIELAIALLDPHGAQKDITRAAALGNLFSLWDSGALKRHFSEWIAAQHGDETAFAEKATAILEKLAQNDAPETVAIYAPQAGYLTACDARALGNLMVELGAGRQRSADTIDDRVSLEMCATRGDAVDSQAPLCRIYKPHLSQPEREKVQHIATAAFTVSEIKPKAVKNILARL